MAQHYAACGQETSAFGLSYQRSVPVPLPLRSHLGGRRPSKASERVMPDPGIRLDQTPD